MSFLNIHLANIGSMLFFLRSVVLIYLLIKVLVVLLRFPDWFLVPKIVTDI